MTHEVELALEYLHEFVLLTAGCIEVTPLKEGDGVLHFARREVPFQEHLPQFRIILIKVLDLHDELQQIFILCTFGILFLADFNEPLLGDFVPEVDQDLSLGLGLHDLIYEARLHELEEHPAPQVLRRHILAVQVFLHKWQQDLLSRPLLADILPDGCAPGERLPKLVFQDKVQALESSHSLAPMELEPEHGELLSQAQRLLDPLLDVESGKFLYFGKEDYLGD